MTALHDTGYLLDVDNTLLDSDQITADLKHHLEREFGSVSANRHLAICEARHSEFGCADYLGALLRCRFCGENGQGSWSRRAPSAAHLLEQRQFSGQLSEAPLEKVTQSGTRGAIAAR